MVLNAYNFHRQEREIQFQYSLLGYYISFVKERKKIAGMLGVLDLVFKSEIRESEF